MEIIKDNGQKIYYKEAGSGQAIILLHGFCGSTLYWDAVFSELSKYYHVMAIDLRGHGQSDRTTAIRSIEELAEDVHHVIVQKNLQQVYLFGHSLGGYITLAFAEKYPEWLKGYGLIHSTAFTDTEVGKQNRLNAIERVKTEGKEAFVNGLLPNLFADGFVEEHSEIFEQVKQIGYGTDKQAIIELLECMRTRKDRNEVIINSKSPVLIVHGDNDKVITADRVVQLAASHVYFTHLSTGHMSMYENPDALIEVISTFVSVRS